MHVTWWVIGTGEIETKQKNAGHVLATPTTTDGVSQQIISVAPDGLILFWDLRVKKEDKNGGILWTPVWRIQLASPDGSGELTGLMMTLSTKPEAPAPAVEAPKADGEDEEAKKEKAPEEDLGWKSEFALGTEDGQVACGTWVMPEGENASFISACEKTHYGPVVGVQRSPFFRDCLLTVGDWTFSLFLAASMQVTVPHGACSVDMYVFAASELVLPAIPRGTQKDLDHNRDLLSIDRPHSLMRSD